MGENRSLLPLRAFTLALGLACAALPAFAIPIVVVDTGSALQLTAQGFAGQLTLQQAGFSNFGGTEVGVTSDGTSAYTLSQGATTSTVTRRSLTTGSPSVTLSLTSQLDDIAYTNGILYGIVARPDALQIVQINSDATTTPLLTQTLTAYQGHWRLSGASGGSQLLAVRAANFNGETTSPIADLINPVTAVASPLSITSAAGTNANHALIGDTVINTAGNSVALLTTATSSVSQPQLHLPDGAVETPLTGSNAYPTSTATSDEINYAWGATHNALAITGISTTTSTAFNRLYRTPFVWQGSATSSLVNGLAPDNTVLSNVTSASPFHLTGPSAMQSSVTPAAPGAFANRALGTGNFSIDLNTAARGVYTVDTHIAVAADYAHDGITDANRTVDNNAYSSLGFAYDPISYNIIGNGDFELSHYGWDNVSNPNFTTDAFVINDGLTSNHVPWLTPRASTPVILRQILEESTASTPMMLSFDYRLDSFPGGSDTIDLTLNGIAVGHVALTTPSASTYSHFQALLTDPALQNLTNAELRMTAAGTSWAYVDNFSLVAVPEPASLGMMLLPAAFMSMRQRRRRGGLAGRV